MGLKQGNIFLIKKRETYYLPVNYITVNVRFFKEFQFFLTILVIKKLANLSWNILLLPLLFYSTSNQHFRSNPQQAFLEKRCCENIQQIYRNVISIELLCNFIEILLRHGCSPVNFLHILQKPFLRIISGGFFWSFPINI